ncbi:hypothetical protein BO70DRAFT_343107 [Aspergillus heteromorphus CBS 117.55]|uniref:Putative gamma-glutamylcyclotransferase n=1 Tax=Aspergillus heteromorphus CBS 117.55 TaxID=1448321 RepID=A0A317V9Q7_9EURO|nr:uncharacterized protein BO70DRAFT_343107 [Aspergillus heteromorphus CBS 117.55]PWY70926.1 hypothetical protein BO70DRAFT_343107 [Aspergillus heteromorphus CBS 117.55]
MDLLVELESLAIAAESESNPETALLTPTAIPSPPIQHPITARDRNATYLVKLEGPLDSPTTVQRLSRSPTVPTLKEGIGETGPARFCSITGAMKFALQSSSSLSVTGFTPTFIRVNLSPKRLSGYSTAPSLGGDVDPTLPQNRAIDANEVFLPMQDEYPVWYFFYGTLAVPEILARTLGLDDMPVLTRARTKGGVIRSWGCKYTALVDGPASAVVDGWAFRVDSEEVEEALRAYETDYYEVVRCEICLVDGGEVVKGLVFRFVGDVD